MTIPIDLNTESGMLFLKEISSYFTSNFSGDHVDAKYFVSFLISALGNFCIGAIGSICSSINNDEGNNIKGSFKDVGISLLVLANELEKRGKLFLKQAPQ